MDPSTAVSPLAGGPVSGREATLLIADVAALTGVPAPQLRSWEGAGLLHPSRSPNAMRLYRVEDVARVRLIKRSLSNPGRRGSLKRLAAQLASGAVRPTLEDYAGIAPGTAAPAQLAGARYWQAVVEAMVELVVVCDLAGKLVSMNPALRAFLSTGVADPPLTGRGKRAVSVPAAPEPLPGALAALPLRWAARTGTEHRGVALSLRGPDGAERPTLWTVTPLRDEVGTLHGAVGVGRPTTPEQGTPPDDWLAMAAHDLRSPITSILGRLQLARRIVPSLQAASGLTTRQREAFAQLDRHLTVAEVGAVDLARGTETLLDASAIGAGALIQHLEPGGVPLEVLAREAVAHAQAHSTRHAIVLEAADTPLSVIGDRVRLRQVLDNLLANALKFSPDGGPITVRLETADAPPLAGADPPPAARSGDADPPGWALLRVEDAGLGMPAEATPRVFDRYWRAADTARHVRGTGLGLYTSRAIMAAHGGHIWVERSVPAADNGPDAAGGAGAGDWHGTVMALLLPLAPALGESVASGDALVAARTATSE
ncbi:MAG TPA: ATP-binding protein [Chloroflexota bacterium]|nr:ATP-binding protein [Chloroflexota bacterium]